MKGIIIAAGPGSRMGAFTETHPKCLLPIAGGTLLEHTVKQLRYIDCDEIVIIVGHKAEMIDLADAQYIHNDDYRNNNILHSLMKARDYLDGPLIISYSDIFVEPWIFKHLSKTSGDIVLTVDQDWTPYYQDRTMHPVSEAENVFFDSDALVIDIGKHLNPADCKNNTCGEFLGLWKMSSSGTARFKETFESLDAKLGVDSPFQQSKQWRRAYITDIFQEMIDRGKKLNCSLIERGWAELDTEQDYLRLPEIAKRQRLSTIYEAVKNNER